MRILSIKPLCLPEVTEINGDLKSMQSLVGGSIQALYPFEDPVALICHEEGKLVGLPLNRGLYHPDTGELYDVVAGTFFLCGAPPDEEDFASLTDEQIATYTERFKHIELYIGGTAMTDIVTELNTMTCDCCGSDVYLDDTCEVEGQSICHDCCDNETILCVCCGRRIFDASNAGNRNTVLCASCYDDAYTRCDDCNDLIEYNNAYQMYEGSDYDYCYHCYTRRVRNHAIHDYNYKPEPLFYGKGKRFFGIELEIDRAGEDAENAEELLKVGNHKGEHIYCKHDGSLDEGFEIVSHPMSLDYHLTDMPWRGVLNMALDLDYLSHQAKTCGLHIHVSRTAFGVNTEQQEDVIARILYFFEKHWEELLKFSRRTQRQLDQWAARYGFKERPKDILDHAKKGYGNSRYSCINLQNDCTIEFRMFRGTLKYNTFIATLQLVNRVCDVALSMSDEEIQGMSWTSFVADISEPELVQYLKERRLYVNEPIETEEEL